MSGESLNPELVFSLLLESIAGVWARYITENIVALGNAVFVGLVPL